MLQRSEESLRIRRDVFLGRNRLNGEEHEQTLVAALNYASSLVQLQRYQEVKSVLRKTMSVSRRVLGESHEVALKMRWTYAEALYKDDGATLDDRREAVTTVEETERIARRVFGGAHPTTVGVERALRRARAALRARETPPSAREDK